MELTFIGTDHEVTGNYHFLEVGASKVLTDCGMEQGNNVYQNTELPVSCREIDYASLTHAHIGHASMLPWTYARGFRGQVIATYAIVDLCNTTLKGSTHIQEMEAGWRDRKTRRIGRVGVEALYTMENAEGVLKHFEGVAYGQEFKLNNDLTLRFTDVDHLLGSASTEIQATKNKKTKKIVFSGGIGNKNKPLIKDPQYVSETDYVVIESTYDNHHHEKDVNHVESLARIIREAPDRSDNVMVPTFAAGRAQKLLYLIRHTKDERLVQGHDGLEVYVDSPLVVEATHMFKENMTECYDVETKALVEHEISPIGSPGLKLPTTSEESKNINLDMTPKVIISAAGMCDAGRVRHYFRHNLWRQECSAVLTGYQAESTLGRVLQDGAQMVRISGEGTDVRAHIETMDSISGHADRDGLIAWISSSEEQPGYVSVVHGGEEPCTSFADILDTQLRLATRTPYFGSQHDLIRGCQIKGAESALIEKETTVKRRATSVYARLVDASRLLTDAISRNQGGTNRDLVYFTEQILTPCNKWDRQRQYRQETLIHE